MGHIPPHFLLQPRVEGFQAVFKLVHTIYGLLYSITLKLRLGSKWGVTDM